MAFPGREDSDHHVPRFPDDRPYHRSHHGSGDGLANGCCSAGPDTGAVDGVLEDVDLIAEQRGMPFSHAGPLLVELLNEVDGLRDDTE